MNFNLKAFFHRFSLLCFAAGLLFSIPACKTDYTEEAVEKARTYALENIRGISETQRNYIRYTQPQIFENTLFPRMTMPIPDEAHIKVSNITRLPEAPHLDYMHSCIVWIPPGLDAMVVVSGEGERSMRGWTPNR